MTLTVRIDSLNDFCDLTKPKNDEQITAISTFLERFKETSWQACPLTRLDKSKITMSIPLAFLCLLMTHPQEALCTREKQILKEAKSFEKKTQFFLATPGGSLLFIAALICGIAGGASYYYGVNQPQLEAYKTAVLMGLAATIGAVASNFLGFYITGTLPHHASEADNKEQNMWDDFLVLKTKPAAYQLLEWYSPRTRDGETTDQKQARRQLAYDLVSTISFNDVIAYYKTRATQLEKIDIAFRNLLEAKEIIEMQKSTDESGCLRPAPLSSELSVAARLLGYFQ